MCTMMESLSITASEAVHDEKNALLANNPLSKSPKAVSPSAASSLQRHRKRILLAVLIVAAVAGIIAAVVLTDDSKRDNTYLM